MIFLDEYANVALFNGLGSTLGFGWIERVALQLWETWFLKTEKTSVLNGCHFV